LRPRVLANGTAISNQGSSGSRRSFRSVMFGFPITKQFFSAFGLSSDIPSFWPSGPLALWPSGRLEAACGRRRAGGERLFCATRATPAEGSIVQGFAVIDAAVALRRATHSAAYLQLNFRDDRSCPRHLGSRVCLKVQCQTEPPFQTLPNPWCCLRGLRDVVG
jgi:hypothetical protein